ncbi:MAG: hypothetical protein RL217_1670 [Pseudomonadota bacterium]|jgi:toxin ParE1/3/4
MNTERWNVELAPEAKNDFAYIIRWTRKEFGERQAQIYKTAVKKALLALHDGPKVIGVKKRDDIALGIHTLHVARDGYKGRHFIVFRATEPQTIEVLRLLHDSMDLDAHIAE